MLYSHFNYAFRNYYSDDYNYVPSPTIGSDFNAFIEFRSKEPGSVTIDWGDGNEETFDFVKSDSGYYVLAFRSLAVGYRKDPSDPNWGLGKNPAGDYIKPYPNHHYADNTQTARVVGMAFTNIVNYFSSVALRLSGFPLLETPDLEHLTIRYARGISEIPVSRIAKLKKLRYLGLAEIGSTLQYLPDELFGMPELESLILDGVANLSNNDASNIRKVKAASRLNYLSLRGCHLTNYIREFNDIPMLSTLRIGDGGGSQLTPQFPEVQTINPAITDFDWIGGSDGAAYGRANWGSLLDRGVENLTVLNAALSPDIPLPIPSFIYQMRAMATFRFNSSARTQLRTNDFIGSMYAFVTQWLQLTRNAVALDGLRNQFYGLRVVMYDTQFPGWAFKPSGTYQAPAGFVEGSADGTPTTPMERIYVLEKNYAQTWVVKP